MAKTVDALRVIALFRRALMEQWGYIWGATGETWTQAKQDSATRAQTKQYGQKWVGRRVADCSGLFSWAYKQLGGYMYHGSNTMWNKYASAKGTLQGGRRTDGQALKPGSAVFKVRGNDRYHVGLYVGEGKVIEAKGTAYGVVESTISRWDEWAELINTDYDASGETPDTGGTATPDTPSTPADDATGDEVYTMQTQKNGSRGTQAKVLQFLLNAKGYDCGTIDGVVGKNTVAAVKAFQSANGLAADGIVGKKTWAKLLQ